MMTLEKLTIKGFKSIRDQTLELDRLNVFIGGNGVGKSNLIGAFRFLHEVINQRLAKYTAIRGGADPILRFGRKTTPKMEFFLKFSDAAASHAYHLRIDGTANSELVIAWEHVQSTANEAEELVGPVVGNVTGDNTGDTPSANKKGNSGYSNNVYRDENNLVYLDENGEPVTSLTLALNFYRESELPNDRSDGAVQLVRALNDCRVYHFHDTSDSAGMKGVCDVDDNRVLRPQADNLAAYLYYLQEKQPDHFALIQDTVRRIAPFFGAFRLAPQRLNASKIRLEWNEKGHDGYFDATSLSDGTMRFICLATLLLQPDLPAVILLDEPELGLHPAAVTLLADLLGIASERSQVLVATQSVTLINQLTPEQIWTVNREDDQSVFRKLGPSDYETWLEDYSLGELWEKNLIQARP